MRNKLRNIIKNIVSNSIKKLNRAKAVTAALAFLVFWTVQTTPIQAAGVFGDFGDGLLDLLNDAGTLVLVLGLPACTAALGYCAIRKAMGDEMDHKKWNSRMSTCAVCMVIALASGALLSLFGNYFGI